MNMELTPLDTDLIRLDQTLTELVNMGLVKPFFYDDEEGRPTRYRLAGRPGDDEQDEQEETQVRCIERDDRVEAASGLQIVA
jgi:hypothetical protein